MRKIKLKGQNMKQSNLFFKFHMIIVQLILLVFVSSAQINNSEIGFTFLKNYNPKEYKAHGQNFDIVQDDRGIIYVANFSGLLEYDGIEWRIISTQYNSKVTSLAKDKSGRIYVGARGEFGFVDTDSLSLPIFKSLSINLSKSETEFSDIIKIIPYSNGIYFISENRIFNYTNNKLTSWHIKQPLVTAFLLDDILICNVKDAGLKSFIDGKLTKLSGSENLLPSLEFASLIKLQNSITLYATTNQGLYQLKDGQIIPLQTEMDDFFIKNRISCVQETDNEALAIGTARGGIVILNKDFSLRQIINENSGLQNELVKSIYFDKENNIWAALNNGISIIEISSPFTFFDERSGIKGGVTAFNRFNNKLYVATYQGLFVFDNSAKYFHQLKGFDNACWSLVLGENSLLAATTSGIFEITEKGINKIYSEFNLSLYKSLIDSNRIFASTLKGVIEFELINGKWINKGNLKGINEEINKAIEFEEGIVFLETSSKGIIRYNLSDNSFIRYDISNGLPSNLGNRIYAFSSDLYISSESGLMKYDKQTKTFKPNPIFKDSSVNLWFSLMYENKSTGDLWLADGDGTSISLAKNQNNIYTQIKTPFLPISDVVIWSCLSEGNGITWFGGPEGIIRFDDKLDYNYKNDFQALIRRVTVNDDNIIYGGGIKILESTGSVNLPYNTNTIRFDYGSGSFKTRGNNLYSVYLEGFDETWSIWTKSTQKEFTNLPEGDYIFSVKAKNIYGHESNITQYYFTVMTPWFKTIWAYIFYLICAGTFVIGLIRFRSRQLEKEKEALQKLVEQRTSEIIKQKEEIEEKSLELADKNDELEKINVIVKSINSEIHFSNLLNSILEKITVVKGIDKASALVFDKNSNAYKFKASFGWNYESIKENSFTQTEAEEKYLKYTEEVYEDLFFTSNYRARTVNNKFDQIESPKSLLVLLVKVEKKVEGFLILENTHRNDAFKIKDISFLKNIKEHIISAFIKTKILEDLQVTLNNLKNAQTQLVQAEKLASLGQLTAGIAHEIKNPLNFVNNFAELSKDLVSEIEVEIERLHESIDSKTKDYLMEILGDLKHNNLKINEHGKRADSIIRGMLLHSRGKSGEKQLTDINALLAEYVNLGFHGMRAQDSTFNIKIETDYDLSLEQIKVVPQDISRVFLNMVNNSCYSTHEKKKKLRDAYSPVLSVKTKNYDSYIEIRIRDNGEGIPKHVVDKIFNPFFTTKPTGAGTGLGLSLSYDIVVQQHKGEVKVDTVIGEFAEFIITLPKNQS
ncbi:MAG: ATP-binding protein [Ignavibacteria bacterium]|nr:ATP-binding protein [Ignavibacteria bacterium]